MDDILATMESEPATSSAVVPAGKRPFESEAVIVLERLRGALAQVIGHLPGVERAADLERALGLPTKLAWQVHRLARSPNPLAEAEQVPGASGIAQVIEAAHKAGVPAKPIVSITEAMEDFDQLVQHHAGDRPRFETMVKSLVEGEAIDVKLRRLAFRENSRVWGVEVRTALCATIACPGTDASLCDNVSLRGMHEIRRLRASAPFRLSMTRIVTAGGEELEQGGLNFSDGPLNDSPTILQEFCTHPIPEFTFRRTGDFLETYLPPGPIGKQDAPTYYLASAIRSIHWQADPIDAVFGLNVDIAVTKPCERCLVDEFVHETMLGEVATGAQVSGSLNQLGQPTRQSQSEFTEAEVLPVKILPVMRGRAVDVVQTPHVPRYSEMFQHVCERMGWDAEKFVLFRWEFRYPILGSILHTQVRLPEYGKR